MVKEIYEKFSNDSTGEDELAPGSNGNGKDVELDKVNDKNIKKKSCC